MTKKADIGGKRLIGLSPNAWVQWVTQESDVVVQGISGSEFQWVSRENDVLVSSKDDNIAKSLAARGIKLANPAENRDVCGA